MTPGFQADVEKFQLYQQELNQLLMTHQGPVATYMATIAIKVESAAKLNASQPHRAGPNSGSAPGGGPAVRTGRLRGSITWRFAGAGGFLSTLSAGFGMATGLAPITVEIGTNVEYAAYVELGTSKMAARPYLVPALVAVAG